MRFLVTGASGLLGAALVRQLLASRESISAWSGPGAGESAGVVPHRVDLADAAAVADAFRAAAPDVILHAAALARVSECHADPARARRINTDASRQLAELAAARGARLLLVSTDLVFDGERGNYRESDEPRPLSVYGQTKRRAEEAVLAYSGTVVARLSLLVGAPPPGRPSFILDQVRDLRAGHRITLFADEWRSPRSLESAADSLIALARSSFVGLIHLGGPQRLSRVEMGLRLAARLNADPGLIVRARRADMPAAEERPRDVSLDSSHWRSHFPDAPWPSWEEAIDELLAAKRGG